MPVPLEVAERLRVIGEELAEAEHRRFEIATAFRAAVVEASNAGASLREIGEASARSKERIFQIVKEERARREAA
jgi:hypothetical protein